MTLIPGVAEASRLPGDTPYIRKPCRCLLAPLLLRPDRRLDVLQPLPPHREFDLDRVQPFAMIAKFGLRLDQLVVLRRVDQRLDQLLLLFLGAGPEINGPFVDGGGEILPGGNLALVFDGVEPLTGGRVVDLGGRGTAVD
jgi:hypothetical protein